MNADYHDCDACPGGTIRDSGMGYDFLCALCVKETSLYAERAEEVIRRDHRVICWNILSPSPTPLRSLREKNRTQIIMIVTICYNLLIPVRIHLRSSSQS
jgi:hypothetical protein